MARTLIHRRGRSGFFRRRGSLGKNWCELSLAIGGVQIALAARRGWGYSVWAWTSARRSVLAWPGCASYREMENMKRKKKPSETGTAKHVAPLESVVLGKHHSLVAHCAVTQYDDGEPRKAGWFSVRTVGAAWQIEVKDPDTLQLLRVVQATLDDALTLAALLLDSEDAPWEPDTWAIAQAGRKGKK